MKLPSSLLLLTPLLAACSAPAWDGTVQRWGDTREVLVEGFRPRRLNLDDVAADPTMFGVGTLSGPGGDVLVLDGEILRGVLDGKGQPTLEKGPGAAAALLVGASVSDWQELKLARNVDADALPALLRLLADEHGLAGHDSFPFVLEGRLWSLEAKVDMEPLFPIDPLRGDPRVVRFDRAFGRIAGFYSNQTEGELSTPGSQLHAKAFLAGQQPFLGKLERVSVPVGATVFLPLAP